MASFDAKTRLAPPPWAREGYRLFGLILMCVFSAWAARAQAEIVPDLYAVSVPVAEQGQTELQRAANVGLRELAVRISGRSSAASDPLLAPLFANAMRYIEQYRYERTSGASSSWLAQLRFASALVDGELRKAGLPVWGGNRPALQVFLVIEDNGVNPDTQEGTRGHKRSVIDDSSPFANALREQWRRRGLVLHLPPPANSINSTSAVNSDDIAELNVAKVTEAAPERGDGVVLGRIGLASNDACESHWLLNLNAQSFNIDVTDKGLEACVAKALDRLVDGFSSQYAIAANSTAEGIVLRLTGIASFDDYAAALNYLKRLSSIKNVQPVLVRSEELLLQLKVEGSSEQLVRQLALESRLIPAESRLTENSANVLNGMDATLPVTLSYRWAATLKSTGAQN